MAYNGSGVFNLFTPGNPVVTGTTISSSWANSTLSDIATGLSMVIAKDGQTTTTAAVPFAAGIVGVATNSSAAAGVVGEILTATTATSSTGMTSTASANVAQIALTAGDWDVTGVAGLLPAGGSSVTVLIAGLSSTSAAIDSTVGTYTEQRFAAVVPGANNMIFPIPTVRFSLAAPTTVYLVANSTFTSTMTAGGFIRARRMR